MLYNNILSFYKKYLMEKFKNAPNPILILK